jgi:hypothetical protein
MGWAVPPNEKQKHRVVIEIQGPVEKPKWAKYRSAVKAAAKRAGAKIEVVGRLRKTARAKTRRTGRRKKK